MPATCWDSKLRFLGSERGSPSRLLDAREGRLVRAQTPSTAGTDLATSPSGERESKRRPHCGLMRSFLSRLV